MRFTKLAPTSKSGASNSYQDVGPPVNTTPIVGVRCRNQRGSLCHLPAPPVEDLWDWSGVQIYPQPQSGGMRRHRFRCDGAEIGQKSLKFRIFLLSILQFRTRLWLNLQAGAQPGPTGWRRRPDQPPQKTGDFQSDLKAYYRGSCKKPSTLSFSETNSPLEEGEMINPQPPARHLSCRERR